MKRKLHLTLQLVLIDEGTDQCAHLRAKRYRLFPLSPPTQNTHPQREGEAEKKSVKSKVHLPLVSLS